MTKRSLKILALIVFILSMSPLGKVFAADKYYNTVRIYGQDRYETSFNIAKNFEDKTFDNIILASGNNFPDALAGSVLSKKLNAPILLVDNIDFDNNKYAQNYICNHLNKNGNIYSLGGEASISSSYLEQFKKLGNYNFVRLGGNNRFDTNIAIVNELKVKTGTPVVIVSGQDFPDALSISSIAASKGYPIFMSDSNTLPNKISQELSVIKPSKVYMIGGSGSLSENVKSQILNAVKDLNSNNVIRIQGRDRYETSVNICKYFNLNSNYIVLVSGSNFPDALSGSALAAKLNSPIILVDDNNIQNQKEYIDSSNYNRVIILGGNASVNSSIEDSFYGEKLTVGGEFDKDDNSKIVDYKIGDVIGDGSQGNIILTNDKYNVSKLIIQDEKTGNIISKKVYNDYFPASGKIELADVSGDKVKDIIVTMEYGGSAHMQACDIESFKDGNLTLLGTNMNGTAYFPMKEEDLTFSLQDENVLSIYSNISKKSYEVDLGKDKYIQSANDSGKKIYPYIGRGPRFLNQDIDGDGSNEIGVYQDISGENHDDIIASFITYYKYQKNNKWKPVDCSIYSNYPIAQVQK